MADLFEKTSSEASILRHIIFIHGLDGHYNTTWETQNQENEFWPLWLANDIPDSSIWTVSYNASIFCCFGSSMTLVDQATNILERLLLEEKLLTGELIFVGHSLGGLVIKQLLRTADIKALNCQKTEKFIQRIRLISFLATPHMGSGYASFMDTFRIFFMPSVATVSIVRNNPNLRDLNLWYRQWSKKHSIKHLILSETQPYKKLFFIVKPDSSDPGLEENPIPIDANHVTICKPKNQDSEVYLHIKDFIVSNVDFMRQEKLVEQAQLASSYSFFPHHFVDDQVQNKLEIVRRARFCNDYSTIENVINLAEQIINGQYMSASHSMKCLALAWCARLVSSQKDQSRFDKYIVESKRFGSNDEIIIAEAFKIAFHEGYARALQKLVPIKSFASQSAALMIVANYENATESLKWFLSSGLSIKDFDSEGKFKLITIYMQLFDWKEALRCTEDLEEEDFVQMPILLYITAMINLMQIVPDEQKKYISFQVPFNAATFPLASDEKSMKYWSKAQDFFTRSINFLKELGCLESAKVCDSYALWLKLRNLSTKEAGLRELEAKLHDPEIALSKLFLGVQFGLKIDLISVEKEIERHLTLYGGESFDAALARFTLMFTQKSPKEVVTYIDQYREQLEKYFSKIGISKIEIEMLAKAGSFFEAAKKLKELILEGIAESEISYLKYMIEESNSDNPIEAMKRLFEKTGKLADLENLVQELEFQQNWTQVCEYGNELFSRTRSVKHAESFARGLFSTNKYDELADLLRKYPEFLNLSELLKFFWGYVLLYEGSLQELSTLLEGMHSLNDHQNYRTLFVNLAISSGKWGKLASYIENEWDKKDQRDANELLQSAILAKQIGLFSRVLDFLYLSVEKGKHDPNILANAYFLAISIGVEDHATSQWLKDAYNLSSEESGPLHSITLQELVDKTPMWNQQTRDVLKKNSSSELPLFIAVQSMNKSLIEFFLFAAFTNLSSSDIRERNSILAYSGARQSVADNHKIIGIDVTALLTLSYLDILEQFSMAYKKIIIPHSTLRWLLAEKQKVVFHQPRRIKDAETLARMISEKRINIIKRTSTINADLVSEVGMELELLLTEALNDNSTKQKIVVRPYPVYRTGSLMNDEVNLSAYSSILCSCMAIIDALYYRGQLTVLEKESTESYLQTQEKRWPIEPQITDNAILFLDDLTIVYFQHLSLLEKLHLAGFEIYISEQISMSSNILLRYANLSNKIENSIEILRKFLVKNIESGKIILDKMNDDQHIQELSLQDHPTSSIFHMHQEVEAIVVDDRSLNQHRNISGKNGTKPILNTLDILEHCYLNKHITQAELFQHRTNLRKSGYIFIPISEEELSYYLANAQIIKEHLIETAELKAIRENILQIRMHDFLLLPNEAAWLGNIMVVFTSVLKAQWSGEIDEQSSIIKSNWIVEFLNYRAWAYCHKNEVDGQGMITHGFVAQLVALLIGGKISNIKYWNWIEHNFLNKIKEEDPEIYSLVLEKIKEFIIDNMDLKLLEEEMT